MLCYLVFMLVPAIITLDLFWTDEGVKILELQHGRRSGTKGYSELFGINLRKKLLEPQLKTLQEIGWEWTSDPSVFDGVMRGYEENYNVDKLIDGNHALNLICTNKAFQALLLSGAEHLFPYEKTYSYDPNFQRIMRLVKSDFSEIEEAVIKAPSLAVGNGIIPFKVSEIDDLCPDQLAWDFLIGSNQLSKKSIYSPAFSVQERIVPKPLEYKGQRYNAPIRLWMALIPDGNNLKIDFFDQGDHPAPIYYKLPTPIGTGNYHSEILSDIHTGEAVAEVDETTQAAIYQQLTSDLLPELQRIMAQDIPIITKTLMDDDNDGTTILTFEFLIRHEHLFGQNFEGHEDLFDLFQSQFSRKYLESNAFKRLIDARLSKDSYYARFFDSIDPNNAFYDQSLETYTLLSSEQFRNRLGALSIIFSEAHVTNPAERTNANGVHALKPCHLLRHLI